MCQVYNEIGSLKTIQNTLLRNKLEEFKSLDDLIDFKKNYNFEEQKIISEHTLLIQNERINLEKYITESNNYSNQKKIELKTRLQENLIVYFKQIENLPINNSEIIPIIKDFWMNFIIWIKILSSKLSLNLQSLFVKWNNKIVIFKKNKRLNYLSTNFEDAVNESNLTQIQNLKRKKEIVNQLNSSIYGAIGEQRVVDVLKFLPNDYILINDFN